MAVIKLYNKMSPFQRVIVALLLGITTGVVVGEPAGNLEIIGNAYIRLLQMTVLPYVLVSIVGGLGRLDAEMAANIGYTGNQNYSFYLAGRHAYAAVTAVRLP